MKKDRFITQNHMNILLNDLMTRHCIDSHHFCDNSCKVRKRCDFIFNKLQEITFNNKVKW